MAKFYFLLLTLLLPSFLYATCHARNRYHRCHMDKLTVSYPSNKTVAEAGMLEQWDEDEDQMRCAGVTALRITLEQRGFSLQNFDPVPRISYILKGKAVVGISYPWCPSTFHSDESGDRYQKVQRVKKGDLIAVPPGVAHWCFNDGDEELVAITITDLNSRLNQLDPSFKTIYLAGDLPGFKEELQGQSRQTNIIAAFDTEFMAEAMGIPMDLMRKIQRKEERGVLVNVKEEEMRTIVPDKEQEGRDVRVNKEMGINGNETNGEFCSIRLLQAMDRIGDADVFSNKAGWLNKITEDKLPLLRLIDLSAEKGSLQPNAFLAPHWSVNAHSIIYVTKGEGYLQVVDNQGRGIFNENIKEGQLTVVPQYYASMIRAGSSGIDWITFMTASQPMRTPIAGRLSTFTALPLQVMANSYRIPITQALELKFNREHDKMLFPPTTTSYQRNEFSHA